MTDGLEGAPRNEPDSPGLDAALAASHLERDRTLEAMHDLDAALGKASGGENWPELVAGALGRLESSMREEQRDLHRPDALLAMAAATNPRRIQPRIRNLQERYDDLIRQICSLRSQLHREHDLGADDLRHRAGRILRDLHQCRARQADVVFEALELDLGTT